MKLNLRQLESTDRVVIQFQDRTNHLGKIGLEVTVLDSLARQRSSQVSRRHDTRGHSKVVSHIEDFRRGVAMVLQVLEDRLEQERQAQHGAILAAVRDAQIRAEAQVRDIQAQADAEQEKLRKLLESAEARIVGERGQLEEQAEQLRGQVAALQTERDRLAAQLAQAERLREAAERRSQHKAARAAEPVRLRQIAIVDQIFADFRGIQGGQLPGQAVLGAPPAIQAAAGEAPLSSGAAQDAIVPVEAKQPGEDLPSSLPERKDETRQGVWRRILNFVRSK